VDWNIRRGQAAFHAALPSKQRALNLGYILVLILIKKAKCLFIAPKARSGAMRRHDALCEA